MTTLPSKSDMEPVIREWKGWEGPLRLIHDPEYAVRVWFGEEDRFTLDPLTSQAAAGSLLAWLVKEYGLCLDCHTGDRWGVSRWDDQESVGTLAITGKDYCIDVCRLAIELVKNGKRDN